jgi:hypothetical protein
MKPKPFNDYFLAGSVLIVTAAVLLVITVFSGRGDLTTATIVLAGTSCFIAGVFILTLSKGEPLDTGMVSLLTVAGTVNVSRMCADLGVQGDACFIPVNGTVKEVIPVSDTIPPQLPENGSYITGETGNGVMVTPAGMPLLTYLKQKHGLRLPSESDALLSAIGEVFTDVLEVADSVQTTAEGDSIIVSLQGYRLISGCEQVMKESPKCCTMHPCPVCSLIACMYAMGTGQPVTISRVSIEKNDVKLFLRPLVPKKEEETVPQGAVGEF